MEDPIVEARRKGGLSRCVGTCLRGSAQAIPGHLQLGAAWARPCRLARGGSECACGVNGAAINIDEHGMSKEHGKANGKGGKDGGKGKKSGPGPWFTSTSGKGGKDSKGKHGQLSLTMHFNDRCSGQIYTAIAYFRHSQTWLIIANATSSVVTITCIYPSKVLGQ